MWSLKELENLHLGLFCAGERGSLHTSIPLIHPIWKLDNIKFENVYFYPKKEDEPWNKAPPTSPTPIQMATIVCGAGSAPNKPAMHLHIWWLSKKTHHLESKSDANLEFYNVADPHDGGTLTLNTVIEVYDEATHTYVIGVQGDPRFTDVKFTVRFLPGPTPDTSTLKWSCEYTPVNADSPGPEKLMDLIPQVFESFAPHAEEHIAKQQAAWTDAKCDHLALVSDVQTISTK